MGKKSSQPCEAAAPTAVAAPARAALDFPAFRRVHEIRAGSAPSPGSRRWETPRICAGERQRMGPALPTPLHPRYPERYRSPPKGNRSLGNSTAFPLKTPPGTGTRDLAVTGQRSPGRAPCPRALRSAGLSLHQPWPPCRCP